MSPPPTRGEIRELWSTLLTNKDGSLSWQEFIRQFGFSGQTHTYVDAGRNPPRWGDSDYNLRSRKLNSDTEILVDGAKQKVISELFWTQTFRPCVIHITCIWNCYPLIGFLRYAFDQLRTATPYTSTRNQIRP